MQQKIIGFHKDEEGDWVADLECGHRQHVRHDPPFFKRDWVNFSEKRKEYIGAVLNCKRCDEMGSVVAKAVLGAAIKALEEAKTDSEAAMCKEGQFDLALDRLKSLDLEELAQEAIAKATGQYGTLDK